ncbi:MAG: hypothetical protein B6I38_10395 [Anaerolineaceae bacterium 4572_5.1]|nr:MAG: hypothetical protein B6I38_10395 [Anaerolineaceae bacterium 4572_5.1]
MSPENHHHQDQLHQQTQLILIAVAAIILFGALGFAAWMIASSTRTDTEVQESIAPTEAWPTPRPTVTPTSTPAPPATAAPLPTVTPIVVSWQELGYLTSVEYKLKTVVALERNKETANFFDAVVEFLGGGSDRVLLSAVGNAQAGIDMTKIADADVEIDGKRVKIALPPAEVTSVALLPAETEIFDSQQKWVLSDYEGIEVEAMDIARSQLTDWAKSQSNIQDTAEVVAKAQLEDFLRQLGFEEIEITVKK